MPTNQGESKSDRLISQELSANKKKDYINEK